MRINVKTNIEPTQEEFRLDEEDFIVSKTDLKGKITYCNEQFLQVSGFEEAELIDQPHNIVRHPDMPRSVYRFMWETLQQKQEFFGIIKNLCKDGSYYWVFANITPSFDTKSAHIGYYSVRRYPSQQSIDFVIPLYQQMIAEEAKHSNSQEAMEAAMKILNDAIAAHGSTYSEFIFTHA